MKRSNSYRQVTIHPHAHEMLHRVSNATYIHMNRLVGMYIAHEARLLDTMGRYDYQEQCRTKFNEAEMMLEYFEPSDSEIYRGKLKIYQIYLAKLREIAWSINVRPNDFLNYVISAEYESFVNLNKELHPGQYLIQLREYMNDMTEVFDPLTTSIYKTRRQSGFVSADKLKNQGGDTLR